MEQMTLDDYIEIEDPKNKKEIKVNYGDVWQLGNHRLICGDATNINDIKRLLNGNKADLVFTDPPYGMKKEKDGVLNDNLNNNDLLEFNKKWIPLTFEALKDNGSWYCWGNDEPLMDIYNNILKPMIKDNKITFRNLLTWAKPSGQGQASENTRQYAIADEKCLFVMCGVQGFKNNADNYFEAWEPIRQYLENEIKKIGESDQKIANALGFKDGRTVNHWWSKSQWAMPTQENIIKLKEYACSKNLSIFDNEVGIKAEYEKLKAEYYSTRAYFNNTHDNFNNVWRFKRVTPYEKYFTGGHATPKPLDLCARAIKTSSKENEIVLDVFGGSGSTLIACEQLNRKCYMLELDPKWCEVIIWRFMAYSKSKVYKL